MGKITSKVPSLTKSSLDKNERVELIRFLEDLKNNYNSDLSQLTTYINAFDALFPNEQHILIPLLDPGKGVTKLTPVIIDNFHCWEFDLTDEMVLGIELEHNIDFSRDIEIHLSWLSQAGRSGANELVTWQMDYSIVPYDETEDISAPVNTGTVIKSNILIPVLSNGLAHSHFKIPSSTMGLKHGYVIGVTFKRLSTTSNPSASDILVHHAHVEYISDKLGTTGSLII